MAKRTQTKTPAAAAAPPARTVRRKVIATQMGYYGLVRRREGDVFTLDQARHFNPRWMQDVDPRAPERVTTGQEVIARHHDETAQTKFGAGEPADTAAPTGDQNPLGS